MLSFWELVSYIHVHVQPPYLSEHAIVSLLLWFWEDTKHKLDQVDGILEAEGAEAKLVFNSMLSHKGIIINTIEKKIKTEDVKLLDRQYLVFCNEDVGSQFEWAIDDQPQPEE